MAAASYHLPGCIVDSGPLIYLAKLEALDAFEQAGYRPFVPKAVVAECASMELAFTFPDAATIRGAIRDGTLTPVRLARAEARFAGRLAREIPALGGGERETMAVAHARQWPAVLFERRASAVARMFGIPTLGIVELLFAGTAESTLLERRIRAFAVLVDMRAEDRDALLERVAR